MMRVESLNSLIKLKQQRLQLQRDDYQRLLAIAQNLQTGLHDHTCMVQQFMAESHSPAAGFTRDVLLQNKHYFDWLAASEKQLQQTVVQAGQLAKQAFADLNETLQEYQALKRLCQHQVASKLAQAMNAGFKLDDELALLARGDR